jgi:hypothetical protein
MPVIRNSVLIRCLIEVAFDYLSDHGNELEWNPKCQVMERLTIDPVGVGTRWRAKWRSSPDVELEIVDHDPPHCWTTHNDGAIEVTLTGRLESTPDGTVLHTEFEPTPHGWFRLVFPPFLLAIRREERANMQLLRVAVEKHAATLG